VAVVAKASCTTTSSARSSARRTVSLVRHRLCRVGARDPQRLDLAVGGGLEHLHRGLAELVGHRGHAPKGGDLGAMARIGQVPVRGQQVGQPADLAPAHRHWAAR
jgi:hypothetical protein